MGGQLVVMCVGTVLHSWAGGGGVLYCVASLWFIRVLFALGAGRCAPGAIRAPRALQHDPGAGQRTCSWASHP